MKKSLDKVKIIKTMLENLEVNFEINRTLNVFLKMKRGLGFGVWGLAYVDCLMTKV